MTQSPPRRLAGLSPRNIAIAMIVSLGASAYLIYNSFEGEALVGVKLDSRVLMFGVLALGLMVGRHLAYMYRVWLVTGKVMSLRQTFEVIMMWEYASAVTPSTVGGAAVAMFILNKEGINMGKSTASVMVITLMDNIFFVSAAALALILVGPVDMFGLADDCAVNGKLAGWMDSLQVVFYVGFSFSIFIASALIYGLFVSPHRLRGLLIRLGRTRLFRRWQKQAERTGDEIITSSVHLRKKGVIFWVRLFLVTTLAWGFKYMVVNTVFTAFAEISGYEQFVIVARVMALWVVMLIPLLPGASGLAEVAFVGLMCTFAGAGMVATVTILWRAFTYYPYLVAGAFITPRWLRRVYRRPATSEADT